MTDAGQDRQVRLASIVAIDVAGFSTMSERDQRRAAAAIERLNGRIADTAARNNGRVFNTAGDGFMLEFGSAGSALAFIQDLLDKRPKGQPPIRVGAHVGDVIVTVNNDLLGHGVNIAARLQSLAAPNSALVSGEFRSMARSSPSVAFQAKGRQPLENINQRVQTFAILSGGERFRRLALRGASALIAVAALTTVAFFGAQIGDVISSLHIQIAQTTPKKTPSAEAATIRPKAAPISAAPASAAPSVVAAQRKPGDVFRDCADCPEMVVVAAGTFSMGSPVKERGRRSDEGPQHQVAIKQFAISKYEITFADWDACLAATACGGYSPSDHGWGRARRPVVGISWADAQAYVAWLNTKAAGATYRLPTEAEWEYSARAGGAQAYGAAAKLTRASASFAATRPDPVGSYEANAFGLYDLAGNAAEWALDCYAPSYANAPPDGSAVNGAVCAQRVYRGGSYKDQPNVLRAASRMRAAPTARGADIGFRLVRELN